MDLGRSSEEYSSESSGQDQNYGNILNQEQVASSIKVCLFYNSIYGMIEVKFKVSVSKNIQNKCILSHLGFKRTWKRK